MDTTFPAAHSMDTTWFAIDRAGHVGRFSSGEAGAVPFIVFNRRLPEPDWQWAQLRDLDGLFDYEHAYRFEYSYQIPAGDIWLHNEGARVSGPYAREAAPEAPIHVDQFPPALRAFFAVVRFAGLSFADERAIQPVEHFPCDSHQAEYLTMAGQRRPFPESPPQEGT
jgi:hypothetical protein